MTLPLRPNDPARLGRYELIGRLGEGGMGSVYLGRTPDGRQVAVKVIRPEYADQDEFRARFRSEVESARKVPSFSTAAVVDADPDHSTPYLVVEYVDGPSLTRVVAERGPLTGGDLHGVAIGTATALTAIHGAGVIHRDLKPSNVLFSLGSPKVIDFGIARAFEATTDHTRSGQVVGTVSYMAPERFDLKSDAVGPAADVFSWGAVVTYAATGRTPFHADTPTGVVAGILTKEPNLDGVPEPLRTIVTRALAKNPADRPTATALLDMLIHPDRIPPAPVEKPADQPVEMPPGKPSAPSLEEPAKGSRRVLVAAAAGVAVVLLGVSVGAWALTRTTDPVIAMPQAMTSGAAGPAVSAATRPSASAPAPAAAAGGGATHRPATGAGSGGDGAVTTPSRTAASPSRTKAGTSAVETSKQTGLPKVKVADGAATESKAYFVRNLGTGHCFDMPSYESNPSETPIAHFACRPTEVDNQEWKFIPRSTGEGYHLYWIQNIVDGMCVDVPGAYAVEAGTGLMSMGCYDSPDNQYYRLEPKGISGGLRYFWLREVVSDLCVAASGTMGDQLVLKACGAGDNLRWALLTRSEF